MTTRPLGAHFWGQYNETTIPFRAFFGAIYGTIRPLGPHNKSRLLDPLGHILWGNRMRLLDPLGHILWGTRIILLTLSLPNRIVVLAQLFLTQVCRQVDRIRNSHFPELGFS